jgi:transglutaminase-like putative cysteine protease
MPTVTVHLTDPVPPGAPLLLAPVFPPAFGFAPEDFAVEDGEVIDTLTARNSGQQAYLIRPTGAPRRPLLHYRMAPAATTLPEWAWTPPENRYVRPSPELAAFIPGLVAGANSEREALLRIVDHAARHFWYGHGPGDLMEGRQDVPMVSTATRGHCVDQHGWCVAACRVAGIEAAYTAGFWFKAGSHSAPGMHCWFAARVEGEVVPVDVSHQLKVPTYPVVPGLNPVPGLRFLAAAGKGLVFELPGGPIELSHLARFVWRTEDGRDHYPAHALQLEGGAADAPPDGPGC